MRLNAPTPEPICPPSPVCTSCLASPSQLLRATQPHTSAVSFSFSARLLFRHISLFRCFSVLVSRSSFLPPSLMLFCRLIPLCLSPSSLPPTLPLLHCQSSSYTFPLPLHTSAWSSSSHFTSCCLACSQSSRALSSLNTYMESAPSFLEQHDCITAST